MKHSIRKKIILFSLLYIVLTNSAGCWDNRDLTEISIISAIGIEKVDNEFEITVQIMKPAFIEARKQGGEQDAYWFLSKKGDTIFEAGRNLLSTVDRKPYYGHVQLVVIGESIAKAGVQDVIDFFERDHEMRRQAHVLISKGVPAKDILKAKSELENIPALHITDIIENNIGIAKIKEIRFFELIKEISSQGKSPVVSVIESIEKEEKGLIIKNLKINNSAVFRKDKLVGWMGPNETRGYLFTIGMVKGGIMNIPNPKNPTSKVAIEIKKSDSKTAVKMRDNKPLVHIDINFEGNIGDQQGGGDLNSEEMVKKMEDEIVKVIKAEVNNSIRLGQEYKADIFGFGEYIYREQQSYWNKVKDQWDSNFRQVQFEINVNAKLRRPGLIKYPVEIR